MKLLLSILVLSLSVFSLTGQNTVGVTINKDDASKSYCFFSPFSGTNAYMIDNCGRLINKWERGTRPGLAAYFLENGLMLRTYKPTPQAPFTSASNSGGLELVDWDNNTVWSYELNTPTEISHHDAVYMPNGNILMLTWELVYTDELIEMGRNPSQISNQGFMWSEKIIEIEPIYPDQINIVWQWEIKDHYIQDFDASKQNIGIVEDHPELFDLNLPDINSSNSNASRDWNHFNAIDYNESLDQILISTRNSDEIWILDHSTTTQEAASHSGGNSGKGGDILYRWGNASAYRAAPISAQVLFGQHGVNWIKEGLTDAGKILIFNNGNGRPGTDYSIAQIIDPPTNTQGNYFLEADGTYGPEIIEWSYGNASSDFYYSPYLSNAQRLTNGNTLINAGSNGIAFEINENKEIVWSYTTPLFANSPATQGQSVSNNASFRVYKYPSDYPGFLGIDLSSGNPIEINPNLINCETSSVGKSETINECQLKIDAVNKVISSSGLNYGEEKHIIMHGLDGKKIVDSYSDMHAPIQIDVPSGIYILTELIDNLVTCRSKIYVP